MGLEALSLRRVPKLSDREFQELKKFIYDKTGIDIPDRRKYLIENKVGKRVLELKLSSFSEYLKILTSSPNRDQEFKKLCELITINETSFFRDIKQLTLFKNFIFIGNINDSFCNVK